MEASNNPDDRERERFYGTDDGPPQFRFEWQGPDSYRVLEPFEYVDHWGYWYRVPVDVENNDTDFASIPPFLTWLVPKDGRHTPAAILHDALIGGTRGVDYETSVDDHVSDRHADYLFREAMGARGVSLLRRWLMWAAVALRTLTVRVERDGNGLATGTKRDYPRMIAVGLAVLALALLSTGMALDVPDLLDGDLPGWIDWIGWVGDRPWYTEIALGLGFIVASAVATGLAFAAVLGVGRGSDALQRSFVAGLIGGGVIGFLGLPMIASAVGVAGYVAVDQLIRRFTGAPPKALG